MKFQLFSLIVFMTILSGCNNDIQTIEYGVDECHWCQMRIMDPKFGAEAVTEKGRVYKFDSGECLIHYLKNSETQHSALAVTDFESPEGLLNAEDAWYLVSKEMPSPMGGNLNSFHSKERAESYQEKFNGSVYTWGQIKAEY